MLSFAGPVHHEDCVLLIGSLMWMESVAAESSLIMASLASTVSQGNLLLSKACLLISVASRQLKHYQELSQEASSSQHFNQAKPQMFYIQEHAGVMMGARALLRYP